MSTTISLIISSLGVLGFALVVVKVYQLYVVRKQNQKQLAMEISEVLKTGSLQEALSFCNKKEDSVTVRVAKAGITESMAGGDKNTIQDKMDSILVAETNKNEKSLGWLALIANLATLTGLVGTILGLIHAFSGIKTVDAELKAKILSEGISLAANATAYGLLVAVPLLIAYAILNNRAAVLNDDMNKAGLNIFIQLAYKVDPRN